MVVMMVVVIVRVDPVFVVIKLEQSAQAEHQYPNPIHIVKVRN